MALMSTTTSWIRHVFAVTTDYSLLLKEPCVNIQISFKVHVYLKQGHINKVSLKSIKHPDHI